jgi:hypothetical protein
MTIFNILDDIFRNKTGELINNNEFNDALQSPYMLQRWVSMNSTQNALLVSETTNKLCKGLSDDKEMWYKLYLTLVDKSKSYKKIRYLKRDKKVVNEDRDKMIAELARRYEISKKEAENRMKQIESMNQGET